MGFYSNDEFRANEQILPGRGELIGNLYSADGFPVLLYRAVDDVLPSDDDGRQMRVRNLIQGHALDTLMVRDSIEMDTAIAAGWHSTVVAAVALDEVAAEVDAARRGPGRPRKLEA